MVELKDPRKQFMKRFFSSWFHIQISLWRTKIALEVTWVALLPVLFWAIATLYVPILGANLTATQTWAISLLSLILVVFSLFCHLFAHDFAARIGHTRRPESVSLHVFGDAAQAWTSAGSLWGEILAALSGPLVNLIIAGLAYLVYNAQLNAYLNLSMLFTSMFSLWLAAVNMAPVYPLDGGRIARAFLQRLMDRPDTATSIPVRLGYLSILFQLGWGIFLLVKPYQTSYQTSAMTIGFAVLLFSGLILHPARKTDGSGPARVTRPGPVRILSGLVTGLVLACMAGIAATLLLTNNGIEAPGFALSVEPMVEVPQPDRYQPGGTFILTSVISQSPIPLGGWLLGKLSPAYNVLPPEKRTPNQIPAREEAIQNYQMLSHSEIVGTIVGMRLAGYQIDITGKGAQVMSVLPESLAQGLLQPGDVIVGFNGETIQSASDLIAQMKNQTPHTTVHLMVSRDQQVRAIDVELTASQTDNHAILGITVQDAGFDYQLPIPVKIVPQKIVGGPSAGLMFALTVYNMLTPTDLSSGLKIAGTGTISLDGTVGPIGGVAQKVAAAESVGAKYFLSPAENYPDARAAARRIKVIKVTTIDEAIQFLQSLSKSP